MREILELREVGADDSQVVGMAGARLASLAGAKIPTPRTFIVTTSAYDLFLEHNNVKKELEALLAAGNHARASELIENSFMPDSLVSPISKAYNGLSMNREMIVPVKKELIVSVTASPVQGFEMDLPMQSASDPEGVVSAIIMCWSFLFSDENVRRMSARGISPKDAKIAVLVQSVLKSEKAGTARVAGGMVDIEASWGVMPPADIISVPDRYRLDKTSITLKEKRIGNQKRMYKVIQGRLSEVPVPLGMNDQQKLIEHEVRQIVSQALKVEKELGGPVEMGWVKFVKEILITKAKLVEEAAPVAQPASAALPAMAKDAPIPPSSIVQPAQPVIFMEPPAQPIIAAQSEPPAPIKVTIPENIPKPVVHRHEPETIEPIAEHAAPAADMPHVHRAAPAEKPERIEAIEEVPVAMGLSSVKDESPELPESPAEEIRGVRDELFDVSGTRLFSFIRSEDAQGELRNDIDGVGLLDVSAIQNADERYESVKQLLGLYHPKEVWVLASVANADDLSLLERLKAEGYGNVGALLTGVVDAVQIPVSSVPLGVLVETPACGISIEAISKKAAFVNIDIQAVTDLTLNRAEGFDESSPAVMELVRHVVSTCRKNRVNAGAVLGSIRLLPVLIDDGISSLTVHQDSLDSFKAEVLRQEKRLVLEKLGR